MLTFYISMLETEEQQDKFSYIYQNYVGFMYHVAKEVVKEHYLAEDVVHETFLQLIRIIDKVHIDDELTLRAFLRRVTHNKAVDCVRKWDKVRPTEDDELERYDTKHKQDPETIAIDALAFNELIAMISKMDDRYSFIYITSFLYLLFQFSNSVLCFSNKLFSLFSFCANICHC